jgi:hypothetical protein
VARASSPDQRELVGVVSSDYRIDLVTGLPDIYTDVSKHVGWIKGIDYLEFYCATVAKGDV